MTVESLLVEAASYIVERMKNSQGFSMPRTRRDVGLALRQEAATLCQYRATKAQEQGLLKDAQGYAALAELLRASLP